MAKVGRPLQRDINGNEITKCLLNVTVPVELANYLRRENIPRSELFTKVVTQMHKGNICSRCYSIDVVTGIAGNYCNECTKRSAGYPTPVYYHYNNCNVCGSDYRPGHNNAIAIKGTDDFGCQRCQDSVKSAKK